MESYQNLDSYDNFDFSKIIVWKISGDIDDDNFKTLLINMNKWHLQNYKIVIVFGAGTAINKELTKIDAKIEYINGQRKTSSETIDVICRVIETQQERLINISKNILYNKLVYVDQAIFSAKTNLFATHGFVIEPSTANIEPIINIWNESNIALVSFLGTHNNLLHNANADICASCLAIELNADWVGSEKEIDGMMELLSKSANTFYTDISISIFGNPLIQVGDFVKLVYTLKRIGTDSSKPLICLVTSVSQGFSEGLSETQLTIKPIIMP